MASQKKGPRGLNQREPSPCLLGGELVEGNSSTPEYQRRSRSYAQDAIVLNGSAKHAALALAFHFGGQHV
jgi:hypothetical protein